MPSLLYISRMNIMSPRAHVYNTLKTCEALQHNGMFDVTLVSASAGVLSPQALEAVWSANAVTTPFQIIGLDKTLKSGDSQRVSKLEMIVSNSRLILYLMKNSKKYQVVYCRDPYLYPAAWVAKRLLGLPLFFEIHAILHRRTSQRLVESLTRLANGALVISRGLEDYYRQLTKNIATVYCSAAEPERFKTLTGSVSALRQELALPQDKVIFGYTGNVSRTGNNDSYGIEDIISCLPLLPAQYMFVAVGKRADDTKELEALADRLKVADRVIFVPWTTKDRVTKYIRAFDLLVIPSAGAQVGNSPTKIFEYLVSGRPIVAAQTQAIAEILTDHHNCLLVDYKKPEAWSQALQLLSDDTELRERLINQAQLDGAEYTWDKRAQALNTFITKHLPA